MSRVRLRAGLVAAALAAAAPAPAADREAELEALRRAIAERRERVSAYEQRERGLFEAIHAVDEAVRALREETRRAAGEAQEARERLAAVEAESADLAARLARTQRALGRRAAALYKAGELGPVRLVFAEGSVRDRVARIQALQRMLDGDARLLARYREEAAALERARDEARAAAVREREARALVVARRAELEAERQEKAALLRRVRADRARERAVLNELEAAARALEETLARLREEPVREGAPPPGGFTRLRGQLEPPVSGGVLRAFGRVVDAEFRTETFRKGVDFATEVGEPVYAVADATVRFAGWFRGYGKLVILDHGDDYFTVSGHLDEVAVAVGDAVRAGDLLGSAGETGSLTGPRLYFEIRRGGEALDPAEWLRLVPGG